MNKMQTLDQNKHIQFSEEQVQIIKSQIAKNATDDELMLFVWQCERTGLDPFARQIYFIKDDKGKVQIQTSIDGFRLIAGRSGAYEGQTPAQWCGDDGIWKEIWADPKNYPMAARVGVYKKGFREALYAVAHWDEYFKDPKFMHKKMPALMLAKVAESLALRKAFPNEMRGLYTEEEMGKEPTKEDMRNQVMAENGFSPPKEYRIPFGTAVGRGLEEAYRVYGPEKLMHSVYLTEEKLEKRVVYSGSTREEMHEYIQVMSKFLGQKENDSLDKQEEELRPEEGEFGKFKGGFVRPRGDDVK